MIWNSSPDASRRAKHLKVSLSSECHAILVFFVMELCRRSTSTWSRSIMDSLSHGCDHIKETRVPTPVLALKAFKAQELLL